MDRHSAPRSSRIGGPESGLKSGGPGRACEPHKERGEPCEPDQRTGVALMSYDPSGGLTGWDLTGFHEGHDTECWRRLGAQEMTVSDSERGSIFGTRFSVWAPNAQAVRLVGD